MDNRISQGRPSFSFYETTSQNPPAYRVDPNALAAASAQPATGTTLPYRVAPNIAQIRFQTAFQSPAIQSLRIPATGNAKLDEALRFLQEFDVTRLGVEAAGGRGSVSSSMEMLRTLLKMAPPDMEFQVVYEKTRKEPRPDGSFRIDNVAEKLEQVLGTSNFQRKLKRQVVNFHGRDILFVEEGSLTSADKPRGKILGMVGANDAPDHHVSRWQAKLGNNPVVGSVSVICTGEPHEFDYAGPPSLFFPGPVVPGKNPQYLRDIPTGYPSNIPNLSFAELEQLAARLPEDTPSRKHKKKVVGRIFKLLRDEKIDLIPVYGVHHPRMKDANRDMDLITNICGAVRRARKPSRRGDNIPIDTKPTVVAVMGGFKDIHEYKNESFLGRFFSSPSKKEHHPDLVCKAWDHENQVDAKLKNLGDDQVMCLYLGSLETELFDQFLLNATLPPFVEGANSSDKCQKLPKQNTVYLQMLLRGTKYSHAEEVEEDQGRISEGRNFVTALSEKMTKGQKSEEDQRNIRTELAQVICDSRVPTSPVRQYYERVSNAAKQGNQVVDLLCRASQELRVRESAPAEDKPSVVMATTPSRNGITYKLWTDGDVSYRTPAMPDDEDDDVLDLDMVGDPKKFGHDHWEWYCDLRVTAVGLDKKGNPLFTMTGPREETYVFQFSEENPSLKLVEKNGQEKKGFTYKLKLAEEVEAAAREQRKENRRNAKAGVGLALAKYFVGRR